MGPVPSPTRIQPSYLPFGISLVKMPRYEVDLRGTLVDTWEVEADAPEDATEAVRSGEGRWVDQRWDGEPKAKVRDAES